MNLYIRTFYKISVSSHQITWVLSFRQFWNCVFRIVFIVLKLLTFIAITKDVRRSTRQNTIKPLLQIQKVKPANTNKVTIERGISFAPDNFNFDFGGTEPISAIDKEFTFQSYSPSMASFIDDTSDFAWVSKLKRYLFFVPY